MQFDIDDFLRIMEPGTVVAVGFVGVLVGALFYRDRRAQAAHLASLLVSGLAYNGILAGLRGAQGASAWEIWVAAGFLWLLFVVAIGVGSRLHGLPGGE
jgi:hypothetical protein